MWARVESGIGSSLGAANRSGHYGIGFLPAYMIDHARADRLERVLRECLDVPPWNDVERAGIVGDFVRGG